MANTHDLDWFHYILNGELDQGGVNEPASHHLQVSNIKIWSWLSYTITIIKLNQYVLTINTKM